MIEKIFYASAGTGKTESLLNVVFDNNLNAKTILERLKRTVFLSFSNATKDELMRRIYQKIQSNPALKSHTSLEMLNSIRVFTLHGFAVKILRKNVDPYKFTLPSDAQLVESEYLWEAEVDRYLDSKNLENDKQLSSILKRHGELLFYLFDLLKNNLTFEPPCDTDKEFVNTLSEHLSEVGVNFINKCVEENIFTFDSAVYFLLKDHINPNPEDFFKTLEDHEMGIEYLLIDEAQDNDMLQNYFISRIHNVKDIKIYIAGDPKQAIYFFRDAIPEYLFKLKEEATQLNNGKILEILNDSKRIRNRTLLRNLNEVYIQFKEYGEKKQYETWHFDKDGILTQSNPTSQDFGTGIEFYPLCSHRTYYVTSREIGEYKQNLKKVADLLTKNNQINTIGIIIQDRNLFYDAYEISKLPEFSTYRKNLRLDVTLSKFLKFASEEKTVIPENLTLLLMTYYLVKFEMERRLKREHKTPFSPAFLLLNDAMRNLLENLVSKLRIRSSHISDPVKLLMEAIKSQPQGTFEGKFVSFVLQNIPLSSGISMKQTDPFDKTFYDRAIISILARLVSDYYKFYKFSKGKIISNIDRFSLPPIIVTEPFSLENQANKTIEITTIHQAKGKTYDATIALWWGNENVTIKFKSSHLSLPDVGDSDTEVFVRCEEALNISPTIKVYIFKSCEQIDKESFNLAYVALTRSRYFTFVFVKPQI